MKLTLPQQDVYFEQLLYPEDPIYNIGAKIAVHGTLDVDLLDSAYRALIEQHDAYRSVIVGKDQQAEIKFLDDHHAVLERVDFSDEPDANARANDYMNECFVRPFDLGAGTLLHTFVVVKVSDTLHYLFSMYHHIITDGWGTSLMFQRWVRNYNELKEFGSIQTEYPFTYSDFVVNDEEYQASEDFETDKAYWLDRFEELPQPLFEKLDPAGARNRSKRKVLMVNRAIYNQLEALAKEHRCSTFHVILAILFVYFSKKQNNHDFAIGLPVLNRGKSVFKKTVGLFMGVAALRMQLDLETTFVSLLQEIRQQLRQDYRHQRFPIGKLIQELKIFHEKDRLFNLSLSYEKQNYSDHFEGTQTTVVPMTHGAERVALAIYIREFDSEEDVKIDFDYHVNYFTDRSIQQVVRHFEQLMNEVLAAPDSQLSDLEYLTRTERTKLQGFNPAAQFLSADRTLLDYFTQQVEQQPDKIAVRDPLESYSYQRLDALSNLVARGIHEKFDQDSMVPVLMDRSANLIVTFLGVLKSGRAFIPLDPQFPSARLAFILEHSGAKTVVSTQAHTMGLRQDFDLLDVDALIYAETLAAEPMDLTEQSHAAYVIYTSGSTGLPKGVEIGHRSLLNFLLSMTETPGINSNDLLYSVTTQSFDISILEFFAPLLSGATVYVSDHATLSSPIHLLQDIELLKPTMVQGTPSFFQLLFNAGWTGISDLKVLCGGDLLSEALAGELLDTGAEVWNMYGPTETTIWSTIHKITNPREAAIIGKPIRNTRVYVLEDHRKLLPVGAIGTLYIAGDGLANGYLKNQQLTADKFIEDPFQEGTLMYDTGDLASWQSDGSLQFHGRSDNQVKVRGYRIELGEIETRMNEMEPIAEAVVVAHKPTGQDSLLVAYVIPEDTSLNVSQVIEQLAHQLPEYMIPQQILEVDAFPLTPNKKVDRKELSQRPLAFDSSEVRAAKPRNSMEARLAEFYQQVLELEQPPSVTDNFFALGGHSLKAVSLINLIEKEFGYVLPLRAVFEQVSVSQLAGYLNRQSSLRHRKIEVVPKQESYPLTAAQYPLWLGSQQQERSIAYNMCASYRVEGSLDEEQIHLGINQLIRRYEVLRTNFKEIDGSPRQVVRDPAELSFQVDHINVDHAEVRTAMEAYLHQEFNLGEDLLLRVGLITDASDAQYLVFVTHHIIMDGWSLEILMRELIRHFRGFGLEAFESLPDLPFQYKDYGAWMTAIAIQQKEKNIQFWEHYLEGYQWKTILPFDQAPSSNYPKGALYEFRWEPDLVSGIRELAQTNGTTLHSLLVSSLQTLLHLVTGEKDICIGTVNAGRNFVGADKQLGMFVKTLPVRSQNQDTSSFASLLTTTHKMLLQVDEHQDIPENILNALRLDILMVLQNPSSNYSKISLGPKLSLTSLPETIRYSRLPLLINFMETGAALSGTLSYAVPLYDGATIEWLMLKFELLLRVLLERPDITLEDINLDLEFEKEDTIDMSFNF
ncbi:MAG: amino acid adenylation domain-containing protein [Bacteroidota bacterium]